ncbi:hypothetical protein [Actinokineospora globicatena]|uniref:hypothetical protein n=1 Tax=Actinokineospora globicatena TaxID=103729 RepID=UPI0020A2F88B|nr:hypothetical protein [Actinokineospora globicatena]MCP2304588.1 hypothetical protein [Actinokineospora globicatena]GLW78042.1 hypothetical protein Aglo01_25240 [Actinokineospora globicatena]GLW85292.1 hypothetical protein Aglo02_29320 [Actinokineospora globicatena]
MTEQAGTSPPPADPGDEKKSPELREDAPVAKKARRRPISKPHVRPTLCEIVAKAFGNVISSDDKTRRAKDILNTIMAWLVVLGVLVVAAVIVIKGDVSWKFAFSAAGGLATLVSLVVGGVRWSKRKSQRK